MKKLLLFTVLLISLNAVENTDIKTLETECSNKNAKSCYLTSLYYIKGEGRAPKKGLNYLIDSCKYGRSRSCMLLGQIFLDKKMYDNALTFFKLGCDYGNNDSCNIHKEIYTKLNE